jgi:hypothetical protein
MSWKRWVAVGLFVAGLGGGSPTARAEDPKEDPAPKKDDAAAAPAEAPKKKDPFFGTTFAMYLETRGGPASIDDVSNPLTSGSQSASANDLAFNGNKTGQFTIGWTLPRGRGQYLLTYNGVADGDYELNATGMQKDYSPAAGRPPRPSISLFLGGGSRSVTDGSRRRRRRRSGIPARMTSTRTACRIPVNSNSPRSQSSPPQRRFQRTWATAFRRGISTIVASSAG